MMNSGKKICCTVLCAAILAGGLQMHTVSVGAADDETAAQPSAQSGELNCLVEEDGNYRYYENGQMVTDSWITTEDGTYYFDEDGLACVLSCKINGDYYIFDEEGRLIQPTETKIVKLKAKDGQTRKYCVDTEGMACSGWSEDKKYYFDKTGAAVTGITVIKEKFYCFYASGAYNKNKTQKIRKTAKYEKPFADLKKYIGKPQKAKYYASCYGKGKDGILTYDAFTVYTFKPDRGAEIFMGAE